MKLVATLTNYAYPHEVYVKVWEKGSRKRFYVSIRRGIQKTPAEVGYFEDGQFYCTSKKFRYVVGDLVAIYDKIAEVRPEAPRVRGFDPENPRNFRELALSQLR